MDAPTFLPQLPQLDPYEVFGFVTGVLGVWLAVRENVWTWPVGLASVLLSLVVMYQARLLADVALQVFYLGITLYGWYEWLYGSKQHTALKIARASSRTLLLVCLIGLAATPAVGWLFARYTEAALPYFDSLLAVFSVLTTFLMGRKLLQHWLFWIVIDLLYTGLFFYKELYWYSALYLLFTALAVKGYLEWRQKVYSLKSNV